MSQPTQAPKKQGKLLKLSLVGVLAILLIGGGVFAAMKILNPVCKNCNKLSSAQVDGVNLDYAFIGLKISKII